MILILSIDHHLDEIVCTKERNVFQIQGKREIHDPLAVGILNFDANLLLANIHQALDTVVLSQLA
jgi:hypothetical protein